MEFQSIPVVATDDPDRGRAAFWCPGCCEAHAVRLGAGGWGWNGSRDRPTFRPSIKVEGWKVTRNAAGEWAGGWERDERGELIPEVCHSYVRDGRIEFLTDSTHPLAGQTVALPGWPVRAPR